MCSEILSSRIIHTFDLNSFLIVLNIWYGQPADFCFALFAKKPLVIISGRLIYQNQILKFENSPILMRWLGLVFVGFQGVGVFWFKLNTYQSYKYSFANASIDDDSYA